MKSNLDRGTSVGFSNGIISNFEPLEPFQYGSQSAHLLMEEKLNKTSMNKVCKEPESDIEVYLEAINEILKHIDENAATYYPKEKPKKFKLVEITDEPKPGIKVCKEHEYEPYFGWCDVEGCENEGCCGGTCWHETGHWTICSKHSAQHREDKPQPQMKQSAIDRENSRDPTTGYLPPSPPIDFKIEENIEVIENNKWEDIEKEYEKFNNNYPHLLHYTSFLNWLKENYIPPEKK